PPEDWSRSCYIRLGFVRSVRLQPDYELRIRPCCAPLGSRLTGIARCDPMRRAGTAVLRLEPDAPAAFKGLSQRLLYGAICVPGSPNVTDRITVNAAIESLRPAVVMSAVRSRLTARCERCPSGAIRRTQRAVTTSRGPRATICAF